jgi:hypothetical protein
MREESWAPKRGCQNSATNYPPLGTQPYLQVTNYAGDGRLSGQDKGPEPIGAPNSSGDDACIDVSNTVSHLRPELMMLALAEEQ